MDAIRARRRTAVSTRIPLLTSAMWVSASVPTHAQCAGDCDGDGRVAISEVVLNLDAALGHNGTAQCANFAMSCDQGCIATLVAIVGNALKGCPGTPAMAPTPTPTPLATPPPTPTSCRAVPPVVAPVISPIDQLSQTIYLCGITISASSVVACSPAGCVVEKDLVPVSSDECPLECVGAGNGDGRQGCFAATLPLLPGQTNAIEVCQNAGVGCSGSNLLCVDTDKDGNPLEIEQTSAASNGAGAG